MNIVKTPKPTKDAKPEVKSIYVHGILGVVLLLVFGSIAFSTVVIWGGTDTIGPKLLSLPAALFDLFIAYVAFSKILK